MSREQVMGIIRHVFTFGGGVLIALGLADESMVTELSGALVTAVGGIWSIFDKLNREE